MPRIARIISVGFSFFVLFFFIQTEAEAAEFYLGYKLSFYNLFQPSAHAFRRNHQFTLGCQNIQTGGSLMNVEAQYNWIDEVKGSVSAHNLTAWVISVTGIFNPVQGPAQLSGTVGQDEACLKYTYFINLLNPRLNRGVIGAEYHRVFAANNFLGMARAGIGFSRNLLPIYGINARYLPNSNTTVDFKLNWLEHNEDNPEFLWKFPMSLGIGGKFASQHSWIASSIDEGLGVEYIWDPAKSHFVSTSDSELTHHWFKGYIGDKFWF